MPCEELDEDKLGINFSSTNRHDGWLIAEVKNEVAEVFRQDVIARWSLSLSSSLDFPPRDLSLRAERVEAHFLRYHLPASSNPSFHHVGLRR